MRIAWFTHRYHPVRRRGRELRPGDGPPVRRGRARRPTSSPATPTTSGTSPTAAGDGSTRRGVSSVDGATRPPVRRSGTVPLQRYVGRLLSYAPHWPTRCRSASYMPILPGIERVRGDYDAVFAVGFPYTIFSYAALQTARAAGAPLILTPFLHLATPGDPVNRKHYTRPHQIRLLAESDTVVVQTALEADAVAGWGIPAIADPDPGHGRRARRGHRRRPRRASRDRLGIPDGRPVVGHLATLDPNKGTHRPGPRRRPAQRSRGRPTTRSTCSWPGRARPTSRRSWPSMPGGDLAAGSRCSARCRSTDRRRLLRRARPLRDALADRLVRDRLPRSLGQRPARRRRRRRGRARGRPRRRRPACSSRSATSTRSPESIDGAARRPERPRHGRSRSARWSNDGYTWDDRFATLLARTRALVARADDCTRRAEVDVLRHPMFRRRRLHLRQSSGIHRSLLDFQPKTKQC